MMDNYSSGGTCGEGHPRVIEYLLRKRNCMKAKLFDAVNVSNPQTVASVRGVSMNMPTGI
jgi:hypothetical protein